MGLVFLCVSSSIMATRLLPHSRDDHSTRGVNRGVFRPAEPSSSGARGPGYLGRRSQAALVTTMPTTRERLPHVDDPVAVGKRLVAARESRGLSQRDLAFAGCSAAYISRI